MIATISKDNSLTEGDKKSLNELVDRLAERRLTSESNMTSTEGRRSAAWRRPACWDGARPARAMPTGSRSGPCGRLPDRFPPAGLAGRESQRMSQMLDRVLGQPDKPELVVFGGDNVMAVDEDEKTTPGPPKPSSTTGWRR